jgi:hypothetical protein
MQKFTYFAEVFTLWWLTVKELTSNKLLAVIGFSLRFVDCGVFWCEDTNSKNIALEILETTTNLKIMAVTVSCMHH